MSLGTGIAQSVESLLLSYIPLPYGIESSQGQNMDGWMDWMDGWMDGRTDGWMSHVFYIRSTKVEISLHIHAVLSAPLLFTAYVVYLYLLNPNFQDYSYPL